MIRRPPRSTRTDTLFPYTTLFRATLFILAQNLKIAADAFGPDQARPVMLAHGGGQTRHAWQACGRRLGENGYYALSVDLRGHGESDWSPDGDYRMERLDRKSTRMNSSH